MKTSNIGFLGMVTTFILMLLLIRYCGASQEKKDEYKGVLVEIFRDDNNRRQYTYKILTSQGYINVTANLYPDSFNYVEAGDSIIKKKDELKITVKKKKYEYHRMTTFDYD